MKVPVTFKRAFDSLRGHALGYPETVEEFPWGHSAIKIKGKAFVFLAIEEATFSMSVKLPGSNLAALTFPFAAPTGYGLGRSGWVTASFGPKEQVPLELLKSWIDESFRAIAPKSLLKRLPQESAGAAPKKVPRPKATARTTPPPSRARARKRS
ncbi:MAG: MmcQ/YjbR family DNA-binding protein [Thermoanaerobaculia bacterium]|nr:MmcQ/YjbR family DNA-binding protein [Thermoanaerobaculia bacterium]